MLRLASLVLLSVGLLVAACSHPERGPAVPRADTTRAMPLGIPNARFFADGDTGVMIQEGMRALDREMATLRAEGKNPTRTKLPPVYYLAVSGGGDNGAYQRRAAERLDRDRLAAGIQDGDRRQHRRPGRALRLPRAELRRGLARGLYDHDPGKHLSRRAASPPPCSMTPWPTPRRLPTSSPSMPTRRCSPRSPASTARGACC